MTATWDKLDKTNVPDMDTITAAVATPLWDDLLAHIEETYQAKPQIEYSGCGAAPGWNVKYKKCLNS